MDRPIRDKNEFKRQVIWPGFENGKTSFTDIDGLRLFVREVDKRFVFIGEVKSYGSEISEGQRMTIETLLDNPKLTYSIGVVVQHNAPKDDEFIDVGKYGYVREIWERGSWKVIREEIKFKDYWYDVIKKKAIQLGINGNKL